MDLHCGACGRYFHQYRGRPAHFCEECRQDLRPHGSGHQRLRAMLIDSAYGQPCARCGKPMLEGEELDLDHDENGGYLGFSHALCNRRAGAYKGAERRWHPERVATKEDRLVTLGSLRKQPPEHTPPRTSSRWD
jgi:hypothetical protein